MSLRLRCDRLQEDLIKNAGGVYGEFRPYEAGEYGTKEYHCGVDVRNRYNNSRGQVATDAKHLYALIPMEYDLYGHWKKDMKKCGCDIADPHIYFAHAPTTHKILLTHARCVLGEVSRCAIRKVLP